MNGILKVRVSGTAENTQVKNVIISIYPYLHYIHALINLVYNESPSTGWIRGNVRFVPSEYSSWRCAICECGGYTESTGHRKNRVCVPL